MSPLALYNKHKGIARRLLFLAGIIFLLLMAYQSWGEIAGFIGQLKLFEFTLSVIIAVVGNVTLALLFNRLLGKHGVDISDALAVKMYMVGQVAKYIPGKVWAVTYQISHVTGISGAKAIVLVNFEIMFGIMFMISAVSVVLLSLLYSKILASIVVALGMAGFVFIYKSNYVIRLAHALSRKVRAIKMNESALERPSTTLSGVVFYVVFCMVYVSSYALMLDSVFGFSFDESILYIIFLSVAWLGGVFAFVVPAGMGVREVIFIGLSGYIGPEVDVDVLVSIAVLTRFWLIVQEMFGVFLLCFIRRR